MPDLTIEDEIKYNTIMSLGRTLPEIKGNIRLEQSLTKEKSRTDVEIF